MLFAYREHAFPKVEHATRVLEFCLDVPPFGVVVIDTHSKSTCSETSMFARVPLKRNASVVSSLALKTAENHVELLVLWEHVRRGILGGVGTGEPYES